MEFLKRIRKAVTDDNDIGSDAAKFLSLLMLLLSAGMSFANYTAVGFFVDSTVSFAPDFLSAVIGLLLISPLYMRGILYWKQSPYTILIFLLILTVVASFVQFATGGAGENRIVMGLLAAAILLSWLGMRSVAGVSWLLLIPAAIYSTTESNVAMGFGGFVYFTSATLGLLLHSGLNPGQLIQGIKSEYSTVASSVGQRVSGDVNSAIELVKK